MVRKVLNTTGLKKGLGQSNQFDKGLERTALVIISTFYAGK